MQMARLLLQAYEKTPAGRIRRGFCMKAQDADFFLRALPNGSRMKNSDLVCCFAFLNCYIYEVSKWNVHNVETALKCLSRTV